MLSNAVSNSTKLIIHVKIEGLLFVNQFTSIYLSINLFIYSFE